MTERAGAAGATGWADRRTPAVERILDAVGALVAERGVRAVTMSDVAGAAGCSRATLYRYFPDRTELDRAYVQREALRVGALVRAEVADAVDGPMDESEDRAVVVGVLAALRHVRSTPALAAWFADADAGRTADLAAGSEVVAALGRSLAPDPDAAAWLVRSIVSLLTVPGRDAADEQRMVERFVVPVVGVPAASSRRPAGGPL